MKLYNNKETPPAWIFGLLMTLILAIFIFTLMVSFFEPMQGLHK